MKRILFVLITQTGLQLNAQFGPIRNLRYEDDFTYLHNDSIQKKGIDKLKFIRLSTSSDAHISFGGELREWYEVRGNVNFGDLPPGMVSDKNGSVLHRLLIYSDLWLSRRVRLFTQINNTLELGSPNEPIAEIGQDGLGLHQAFLELHLGNIDNLDKVVARLGRQEYNFGNEIIISSREGPNNRLSFDAATFIMNNTGSQSYLFAATPVIINKNVFDNEHIEEYIWGWYSYLRAAKDTKVDAYYLGFKTNRRAYNLIKGKQTRHTIGSRVWNHGKPLFFDFESMYQFGEFNTQIIAAYNVRGLVRYYFDTKLHPMIGLGASYVAG